MTDWQWLESTYDLQSNTYGYDLEYLSTGCANLELEPTTDLASYIQWNLFAAHQELAEAAVEFSWKPWAVDEPFVHRDRIRDECIDVLHFVGNILVALGVDDEELAFYYKSKQERNRARAASGSYSAQKGGLGEGSDI